MEKALSDDLMFWRAERPDEWIMDKFIKRARQMETELASKPIIAFVQGAQWWEYHKTGATMWPSDRNLAEDEAEKREKNGTLGVNVIDRLAGIIGNISDSI